MRISPERLVDWAYAVMWSLFLVGCSVYFARLVLE